MEYHDPLNAGLPFRRPGAAVVFEIASAVPDAVALQKTQTSQCT
jgi:hypothetical protein